MKNIKVSFQYRDGANFKTSYECDIDIEKYPSAAYLQPGYEVEMGDYGTLNQKDFFEDHGLAFRKKYDHNYLEVCAVDLITDWNFVEKHYPNYYSSDEILENDRLHAYADGEMNDDAERMRYDKEYPNAGKLARAIEESDRHIMEKAVGAFAASHEKAKKKQYSFAESLADIAFLAGKLQYYSGDGAREDIAAFIEWAYEFETLYPDADYWTDNDYIDTIEEFTTNKIKNHE